MSADRDDFHGEEEEFHDDEEHDNHAPRSIFAAGWFRAVLVLTVLAVVVVVALPYLLNWFEPAPPPVKGPAQPTPGPESATAPSAPAPPKEPAPALPPSSARGGAPAAAKPAPPLSAGSPERPATASRRPSGGQAERRGGYWVQLGVFKDQSNAERLAKKVREQGVAVQVASVTRSESGAAAGATAGESYHLVRAGAFPDRQRAVAARDDLQARGYSGFITQGAAK